MVSKFSTLSSQILQEAPGSECGPQVRCADSDHSDVHDPGDDNDDDDDNDVNAPVSLRLEQLLRDHQATGHHPQVQDTGPRHRQGKGDAGHREEGGGQGDYQKEGGGGYQGDH